MNRASIFASMSILALTAGAAQAQSFTLIDDFNDRITDGWSPYNGTGVGAAITAPAQQYSMRTLTPVPALDHYVTCGSYWDAASTAGFPYTNGVWRCKYKAMTATTNGAILLRAHGELPTNTGHAFGINPSLGTMFITTSHDAEVTTIASAPFEVVVAREYMFEAGAVGSHLTLKVWAVGETEPDAPQLSANDSTWADGGMALLIANTIGVSSMINGSFDDVYFQAVDPCPADLNGDGLVDFGDYLEFLNLFDLQDLRVDFNQDGLVDFSDYLAFLNLYDAGC